jgi:hypothetical protein
MIANLQTFVGASLRYFSDKIYLQLSAAYETRAVKSLV